MIKPIMIIAALILFAFSAASTPQDKGKQGNKKAQDNKKAQGNKPSSSAIANTNRAPSKSEAIGKTNANVTRAPEPKEVPQETSNSTAENKTINDIDKRLTQLENQMPPAWLGESIVLGLIGFLILMALFLHIIHVITVSRTKEDLMGLQKQVQHKFRETNSGNSASANAATLEKFSSKLDQQYQNLETLGAQVNELFQLAAANNDDSKNITTAIAITAQLMGESRIQQQARKAVGDLAESDRTSSARIVEYYKDIFAANANRLKPLAQELSAFDERIRQRPNLPYELAGRVRALQQEIFQFERWHGDASGRLSSLQSGSLNERLTAFRSKERKLTEGFNLGEITIIDYVKRHNDLLKQYFPEKEGDTDSLSPAEQENDLKKISVNAPEYLMDWFDKLSQLQAQLAASQNSIDARTADELGHIQKMASDALSKFDIQPEEIQPGRTSFDNRLYDATLITQSSQFPANTIIGVHQYGFRKISNGEVLRRSKVVVAGVGAAS